MPPSTTARSPRRCAPSRRSSSAARRCRPSSSSARRTREPGSSAPTARPRRAAAASTTGRPSTASRSASSDGEVQVAGPTLADGYLGEPEATDAAFRRDADGTRWYRTGDAGLCRGRHPARPRAHRQRHRLGRGEHLAGPRRAHRPRGARARLRRGRRGARRPLGRGIRRRRLSRRGPPPQRIRAARGGARLPSPPRSGRMRDRPASCWWTSSPPCPRASPTARRSGARSARSASSSGSGRVGGAGVDDAEPVALGVFEHDPVGVLGVRVPVDLARAEREQPGDLLGLVGGVQIEVDARRVVLRIARSPTARCSLPAHPSASCRADRGSPSRRRARCD